MRILFALILLSCSACGALADSSPLACNLDAMTASERSRHAALGHELHRSVLETRELTDGYAFRVPETALVATAEWVALERKCCPFFAFSITQATNQGAVWLRITGGNGVKEFLSAELGLGRAG
jgi:hypothetical protein